MGSCAAWRCRRFADWPGRDEQGRRLLLTSSGRFCEGHQNGLVVRRCIKAYLGEPKAVHWHRPLNLTDWDCPLD
jgi:hypothetical protein